MSATTFQDLGLSKWLCNSLASLSISKPTPIQAACIPPLLEGRNCIGGSRTGSGKTIAFAAPILEIWSRDPFGIYALILTPTRELALQIYEQFAALGSAQDLRLCLLIGGQDMRQQALTLQRKPHVVVATPGRLADHIQTSGEDTISGLRRVKVVVLDEADRLLEESFAEALGTCLSVLPKERQTALFTATMTEEVRELENVHSPKGKAFVTEISTDQIKVPPTLQQDYLLLPPTAREAYLHGLLEKYPDTSCIIFTNRTSTATLLTRLLRLLEHRVTPLHSGLPQRDRIDSLGRFRAQAARILVATDVASRGLDIPEVGMVINFDVPRNPDDYVHRVGRTARAGRKGRAITFITPFDVQLVKGIEERVGKQLVEAEENKELENFVVNEGLRDVSEKKREAKMDIEEGRDEKGRRHKKLKDRQMRKKEGRN